MPATTGFSAGIESIDTQWSYAQETVWNTSPTATAYQALRTTGGDSMQGTEQRSAPSEITPLGEKAANVTTQVSAGGAIPIALSFGTFDDLLSGLLRNDWSAPIAVNGVAGDISLVAAGNKLTSTTPGKFAAITAGRWLNLSGFTLQPGRLFYVFAKTSDTDLTVGTGTGMVVNETPTGTNAKIRGGSLFNDKVFKSYTLRERLGSAGFMHFPGSFLTAAELNMSLGDFLSGSLTFASSDDVKSLTDIASTLNAAPVGRVHDNIRGFGGLYLNGSKVAATLRNVSLRVQNEGAGQDYGMGSASAQGMRRGVFTAGMQVGLLFRDWSIYDQAQLDSQSGYVTATTLDSNGNAYAFQLLNGRLLNPNITAGRPGEPVMMTIDVEGNPSGVNGTLQIDRMAAA